MPHPVLNGLPWWAFSMPPCWPGCWACCGASNKGCPGRCLPGYQGIDCSPGFLLSLTKEIQHVLNCGELCWWYAAVPSRRMGLHRCGFTTPPLTEQLGKCLWWITVYFLQPQHHAGYAWQMLDC